VHIHMRVDFVLLAMNQIVNMVSTCRYGSGGTLKVPMVIRLVIGKGWGQAFQHSKTLHSYFAHIPGLKVVMPSTPNDIKGAIKAAIRDDSPVIILEHRLLYDVEDVVEDDLDSYSLGEGRVLQKGDDVTVVATSWMNVEAVKAAEIMTRRGVSVEVIDPVTIEPLDDELIFESVRKTGHCIVADNDWISCGFSAEVSARVNEKCFGKLKSPVKRIGFAFTPCPCTRPLEDEFYPNAIDIIRAIESSLELSETDLSSENFYNYENKFKGPF